MWDRSEILFFKPLKCAFGVQGDLVSSMTSNIKPRAAKFLFVEKTVSGLILLLLL